jgi:hypothetical protein
VDTLTPEQIEAIGKTMVNVIAALGAVCATVAGVFTAYWTYRTRRDTHYLGDKIRTITGEPLQYRYDPERRDMSWPHKDEKKDPTSRTGETL